MTDESPAEAAVPILWTDNQGAEKPAQAATSRRRTRSQEATPSVRGSWKPEVGGYHDQRHGVEQWRKKILGDGNYLQAETLGRRWKAG
jgi:hypothetical protein